MPLPASFARDGFTSYKPTRRILIGCEGPPDSGKSEFAMSAPGPGVWLCLDRGYEGMLNNPNPPPTRRDDFALSVVKVPLSTMENQQGFLDYWNAYKKQLYAACSNPDCKTVIVDGDGDSWELQRLAEFGRLSKIPPHMYDAVNTGRRALYARLHDSGKNIIATSKVKKAYKPVLKEDGTPMLDDAGREKREWDGVSWERQGFSGQDYVWHVQLLHLYDEERGQWGVRILRSKIPGLKGYELWGVDCCFAGLVQVMYPQVPLSEWGL